MFNTEFKSVEGSKEPTLTIKLDGKIVAEGHGIIMYNNTVVYKLERYSRVFEGAIRRYYEGIGIDISFVNPF